MGSASKIDECHVLTNFLKVNEPLLYTFVTEMKCSCFLLLPLKIRQVKLNVTNRARVSQMVAAMTEPHDI